MFSHKRKHLKSMFWTKNSLFKVVITTTLIILATTLHYKSLSAFHTSDPKADYTSVSIPISAPYLGRYYEPSYNGLRLDYCYKWGQQCGYKAANQWCKAVSPNLTATDFTIGWNMPSTHVMGDNKNCTKSICDRFDMITCLDTSSTPETTSWKSKYGGTNEATYYDILYKGYPLDYCYKWGQQCGIAAADSWCKAEAGLSYKAVAYKADWDRPATYVIGDQGVCTSNKCDRITSITCRKS